jgi:hypothetical protein
MKLGIRIGATTISDILKRAGHYPIPEKGSGRPPSNWKLFVRSHMDTLAATDFFYQACPHLARLGGSLCACVYPSWKPKSIHESGDV